MIATGARPPGSLQRMVRPLPPWIPGYVNGKLCWVRATPWAQLKLNLRRLPWRLLHGVTLGVLKGVIVGPLEQPPARCLRSEAETQPQ